MVSVWRADTKDTLPADTINVFCSSGGVHDRNLENVVAHIDEHDGKGHWLTAVHTRG
jgi:hypothetical protein